MFDARARAYEADTIIADVDDQPQIERRRAPTLQPIAVGRVPTDELAMHVQLFDGWHRLDPGEGSTACSEEPFDGRERMATRNERTLEHPLAPCLCWTPKERAKADRLYLQKWGREWEGPKP